MDNKNKKMLFIYNPHSGKTVIKNNISDIVDIFVKNKYDVSIYPTQYRGAATDKIVECGEKYDLIVCAGGDGTLNETVNGIMQLEKRPAMGYIPTGSTNDFAYGLSIPSDVQKAAEVAVKGTSFKLDIGRFNDKNFVYIAAFGAFTEVSYNTSQDMKNILGHQAYIVEGIKQITKIKDYHVKLILDDEVIDDKFVYAMITNADSAGGFKGITGKHVSLNDGLFEVTLVKRIEDLSVLNDVLSVLAGLKDEAESVIKRKVSRVVVESKKAIPWTTDGEYAGAHKKVEIAIENKAINIKSKKSGGGK